jgi:hypothetical protein
LNAVHAAFAALRGFAGIACGLTLLAFARMAFALVE